MCGTHPITRHPAGVIGCLITRARTSRRAGRHPFRGSRWRTLAGGSAGRSTRTGTRSRRSAGWCFPRCLGASTRNGRHGTASPAANPPANQARPGRARAPAPAPAVRPASTAGAKAQILTAAAKPKQAPPQASLCGDAGRPDGNSSTEPPGGTENLGRQRDRSHQQHGPGRLHHREIAVGNGAVNQPQRIAEIHAIVILGESRKVARTGQLEGSQGEGEDRGQGDETPGRNDPEAAAVGRSGTSRVSATPPADGIPTIDRLSAGSPHRLEHEQPNRR